MIPKILYKTGKWEEKDLPKEYKSIFTQIIKDNPGYKIKYYDNKLCRKFIRDNFSQDVLIAFDTLKPGAYKADLFRYCILYKNGGVYGDLPQEYLVPLSELIDNKNDTLVLAKDCNWLAEGEAVSISIQISFMAAKPHLPIYKKAIDKVVENVKNKFYGKNPLCPTGPILFGSLITNENYRMEMIQTNDDHLYNFKSKKRVIRTKNKTLNKIMYGYGTPHLFSSNHYHQLWFKRNIYNKI